MLYVETKPRQPNPTVYPSNSTPPYPPPKKNIHNIISFIDRKLGQMHRLTNALDLVVLRKRFPSWPTRTIIINRMARLARTPIEIFFVVGITVAVFVSSQICQSVGFNYIIA